MRKLTILGCSSQQPTRKRNHGAYLVRWNEEGHLFDPGEGTQRQFIFADIAPTCVKRIFISHFHGDHCLGVGSMLMRLNLDKVTHAIHCYYPASGKVYFDRLRYGSIYHENITVIEHPIEQPGLVHEEGPFRIEAQFLKHGVENIGWRISERDRHKFDREQLKRFGVEGPLVRLLEAEGSLVINGRKVTLDEVSSIRKGDVLAVVIDTSYCSEAVALAREARLFLCESTYLEEHRHLAEKYRHLTAKQAAEIAKKAGAQELILTHFSARYQDLDGFAEEAREIFPNTFVADDFKEFSF
jgi:ribonuclease Z